MIIISVCTCQSTIVPPNTKWIQLHQESSDSNSDRMVIHLVNNTQMFQISSEYFYYTMGLVEEPIQQIQISLPLNNMSLVELTNWIHNNNSIGMNTLNKTCFISKKKNYIINSLTSSEIICCEKVDNTTEVTCSQVSNITKYELSRIMISLVVSFLFLMIQMRGLHLIDQWKHPIRFWYETTKEDSNSLLFAKFIAGTSIVHWFVQFTFSVEKWMNIIWLIMRHLRQFRTKHYIKNRLIIEEDYYRNMAKLNLGYSRRPLRLCQVLVVHVTPSLLCVILAIASIFTPMCWKIASNSTYLNTENTLRLQMIPVLIVVFWILFIFEYAFRGKSYKRWIACKKLPHTISYIVVLWPIIFQIILFSIWDLSLYSIREIISIRCMAIAGTLSFYFGVLIHKDSLNLTTPAVTMKALSHLIVHTLFIITCIVLGIFVSETCCGVIWNWIIAVSIDSCRLQLLATVGIIIQLFRSAIIELMKPLSVTRDLLRSSCTRSVIVTDTTSLLAQNSWEIWNKLSSSQQFLQLFRMNVTSVFEGKTPNIKTEQNSSKDIVVRTEPLTAVKILTLSQSKILSTVQFAEHPSNGRPLLVDTYGYYHVPVTFPDMIEIEKQLIDQRQHVFQVIFSNMIVSLFTLIVIIVLSHSNFLISNKLLENAGVLSTVLIPVLLSGQSYEQYQQDMLSRFASSVKVRLIRIKRSSERFLCVPQEKMVFTFLHTESGRNIVSSLGDNKSSTKYINEWSITGPYKNRQQFTELYSLFKHWKRYSIKETM
jgi:hypothetical protein